MFPITYFLFGILFITFYPVIQQIVSLLELMLETAKGYFSVKLNEYNQSISSAADSQSVRAIGFGYQYEDQETDDDS